ncbi:MAG: hypothetical protein RLZZ512_1435, partial [Bacteroidota bacterium]
MALGRAVTLPQNKRSHRQGAHHALVVEVLRGFVGEFCAQGIEQRQVMLRCGDRQ